MRAPTRRGSTGRTATPLWIVHRDPRWRGALRRLAGRADALVGDPTEPGALEREPAPEAVVLGVAGDFEAELQWAHTTAARLARAAGRGADAPGRAGTRWVIVARPRDVAEAQRCFDALGAEVVPLGADATALRRQLAAALARRNAATVAERRRRDALAARFARWLGDLELPELLAAIDPARRDLPLLVRGEPGTGRGLLVRWVHLQSGAGGAAASAFASVVAWPEADAAALWRALAPELGSLATGGPLAVCIEEIDQLAPAVQRQLRGWIEDGPPIGLGLRASSVRWFATAGDPQLEDRLEPALASALAGVSLRIPPLRERPGAIERIALETAAGWGAVRAVAGRPAPELTPEALAALRADPWPGNARELEAVVRRSIAAAPGPVIGAEDLVLEDVVGVSAWEPPDAGAPARELAAAPRAPSEPPPREEAPARAGAPAHGAESAAAAQADAAAGAAAALAPAPPRTPPSSDALRRLAEAVAHEVGNPLVGIRTFAQMLPSRFDDPEFRAQFAARVEADTRRIEAVIDTLARLGALPPPERRPVDVSALLSRLLQLQRGRIQERRLVVLEELDRTRPLALGDAEQLRFALGLLVEDALAWVPERGDLYVATRHQPAEGEEGPRLRILLRSRAGIAAAADTGVRLADGALAVAAVEAVVRAHGGSLAVEPGEPGETLVLIDLPAPP